MAALTHGAPLICQPCNHAQHMAPPPTPPIYGTCLSHISSRTRAPANTPVVAVAVLVEDTTGTGGGVAAPIAGRVMRAAVEVAR